MALLKTTVHFDVANPHAKTINQAEAKIIKQRKASTELEIFLSDWGLFIQASCAQTPHS